MPPNNLGNLTYSYDADGRRTATAGGLAAVTLPANVTGTTSYNADNEQSTFNGTSLSYDANGNLTGDGTNTYTWDARNHLTQITQRRTTVATFAYDAFGRRMNKTVNGTTTQFLYDGLNPVQELNSSSAVAANLLTGLGIDEYFTRSDTSTGVTSTPLTDALGSTIGLVTANNGPIATNYTYQPFGATTASGSANGNSYQFTGRENDGTSLNYYRARYYSPTFQRFIAQDPIGFAGDDSNLYAYVGNDPVNFIDPIGNGKIGAVVGGAIGAVAGAVGEGAGDAAIGTVIEPGGGTAAGLVVGAALGAAQGAVTGAQIGSAIEDAICPSAPSKRFTPDQSALIDLAKQAVQTGGVSTEDARTLQHWANELNVPTHGPEAHLDRTFRELHFHIGPIDHIPVK